MSEKKLHLLNLRQATAEDIARFYKSLTGRDVTPEEMEQLRRIAEEMRARPATRRRPRDQ